jgi:chromosome segregation ATPase
MTNYSDVALQVSNLWKEREQFLKEANRWGELFRKSENEKDELDQRLREKDKEFSILKNNLEDKSAVIRRVEKERDQSDYTIRELCHEIEQKKATIGCLEQYIANLNDKSRKGSDGCCCNETSEPDAQPPKTEMSLAERFDARWLNHYQAGIGNTQIGCILATEFANIFHELDKLKGK